MNKLQPLVDGGRDLKLGNYQGSVWGKKSHTAQAEKEEGDDKPDEDLDTEDEEERNRCFFEQMVYWKFEDDKKKAKRSRAEVELQKNLRKDARGQNTMAHYLTMKSKK